MNTATCRDAHGAVTTRRAAFGAAGVGALALLLTSCRDEQERLPAGVATVVETGRVEPSGWETVPFQDSHALEVPGLRYRVEKTWRSPTLPAQAAQSLFRETPSLLEAEEVKAADGEEFLLAVLRCGYPAILSAEAPEGMERSGRILVGDEVIDQEEVLEALAFAGNSVLIAVSVPVDAASDLVRWEVTGGGARQSLSLLDGSLLESPFEHLYRETVLPRAEPVWWERVVEERFGPEPVIAGAVFGVGARPMLPDGTWPAPGNILLSVRISHIPPSADATEVSTLALVLEDGGEASAHGDPAAAFLGAEEVETVEEGGDLAWFEVPHTTESATLRMSLRVRTAEGEDVDLGQEQVALTLSRKER